jgi:hypothetical protein
MALTHDSDFQGQVEVPKRRGSILISMSPYAIHSYALT